MSNNHWSVSGLLTYVKSLIKKDELLQQVVVKGEVANFKKHEASGHLYFTLKDEKSAMPCVMFRSYAQKFATRLPQNGDQIIVMGEVGVYERSGACQIYVRHFMADGQGNLHQAYEALKAKLQQEGLFKKDEDRRPLPKMPHKVGVVTSASGAAIRDFVRIATLRWPSADILLVPATVQGENGAPSIIKSLDYLYRRDDIDVIYIGRGGGSLEDLWNFNEEAVVRQVAASPVPIVSGVGHEPDVVLTDFAADWRASTPSNAAEMIFPNKEELVAFLDARQKALAQSLFHNHRLATLELEKRSNFSLFQDPTLLFAPYEEKIDRLEVQLHDLMAHKLKDYEKVLSDRLIPLEALNPLSVLKRGFTVCEQEGKLMTGLAKLNMNEPMSVVFHDGTVNCEILSHTNNKE